MLVLDELYASHEVLDFLESSKEPVLDNAAARAYRAAGRDLVIAPLENEPLPTRVVALSEMHLAEAKRYCAPSVRAAIDLCKDKAAFRRALAPLYPEYTFQEATLSELRELDGESLAYPVVLKPTTGFFSLGIYPLFCPADFTAALKRIEKESDVWAHRYNDTVVNDESFTIESYIAGQEYALDAYFDSDGNAVVLNVLQHDFADENDTSDRLYFTSRALIEDLLETMTRFLDECNELLGFKDFALHPEVRLLDDGTIIPIEFNPCRFAGLCTTDLSYFAWGIKTYEYFLKGLKPNWDAILEGKEGLRYPAILLTPSRPGDEERTFDYDALTARFSHPLEIRKVDAPRLGMFGTAFIEVAEGRWEKEVIPFLSSDLEEFLS